MELLIIEWVAGVLLIIAGAKIEQAVSAGALPDRWMNTFIAWGGAILVIKAIYDTYQLFSSDVTDLFSSIWNYPGGSTAMIVLGIGIAIYLIGSVYERLF